MCIYCNTNNYRKIYEQHNGPIPREDDGRTYDIHHIDGNHENNDPKNLVALSIQQHYHVHYSQGDLGACVKIAMRMKMSPEQISELSRNHQLKLIEEGRHHFVGLTNPVFTQLKNGNSAFQTRPDGSSLSKDRVINGTCVLLKREDGSSIGGDITKKRVLEGKHNFSKRADGTSIQTDKLSTGTHHLIKDNPNNSLVCCMECRKAVSRPMFSRWHGDNCKVKDPIGHATRSSQVAKLNQKV